MKKIYLVVSIFSIIIAIIYGIFYITINNDDYKQVKKIIPNYFGWKDFVKVTFFSTHFPIKINEYYTYLIKSDGNNSFKLNENNSIYIYSNLDKDNLLELEGVTKNGKINCLNTNFNKDFVFSINSLNNDCKKSIFFIGKLTHKIKLRNIYTYFYFSVALKKEDSKNLLILPTSNFYNYSSNVNYINQYSANIDYIANLSEIPSLNVVKWANKISRSIQNLSNLLNNFDIILDYELEDIPLKNYELIIFPMHQEYISIKMLNKLKNFLNDNKKNKILSIGGANFFREVVFKNDNQNNLIVYPKNKNIYSNKFFKLSGGDNPFKNCIFVDDEKLKLGDITNPQQLHNHTEFFFYKINCNDNIKIPLLSLTNYNNTGNLIHIMTDSIGLNFNEIPYLNDKISNLLQN